MRKVIFTFVTLMGIISTQAREATVESPDKRIQVIVSDNINGQPQYEVRLDGQTVVSPSLLGLKLNCADLSSGFTLTDVTGEEVTRDYDLKNIKQSHVSYHANALTVQLSQHDRPAMNIRFQVSNRDVAFRYELLPMKNTIAAVINAETTEFRLPEATTSFLCPQSKAMTGFARTAPSYETRYAFDEPIGKNGWGFGYTFPCLFKSPAAWVLISETGTDGGYVGCHLQYSDGAYSIAFPKEDECNGWGSTGVQTSLPCATPWRTITIGTLKDITETTVAWDLVSPKYKASQEYTYGKGTWSWIIGMDSSCNYDEQKRYIDFSAAMGYQSVLIDAFWDKQIGYDRIAELARYGRSKGVGLFLWYNSNGSWNDAPQTPIGKMNHQAERRREMKWMHDTGIRGIKVDFFGGDKQQMMQLYEDILTDANEFGLLVIFHGCTLPRGWEMMYPNYAASEAVLASENLHFGQEFNDNEAKACGATYPFTRNTVGSMDFGGSALNKFYNANNNKGTRRITSDVYALATAVLFQSAVQHFALAPNNLTDAPSWAIDFMKAVPTTWDELQFIDGYPGRYVIFARRSGDKWYIAGVNAGKEPLSTTLSLPMLEKGSSVSLYLNNRLTTAKISKKQTLQVDIPSNGGVVIKN